jgi:phospholipid-binding lipoprotein MlaA
VDQGVHDTGRLIFNSTFGIGGLFDIATLMQLPRHQEDFGQTLGVWGVGSGWYLVLPLLGPSTVRDAVALPADVYIDPLYRISDSTALYSLMGVDVVDTRSRIPPAAEQVQAEALDPYLFTRDAYLQRRQRQIEGEQAQPPPLEEEEEQAPPEGGKPGTVANPGQE